VADGEATVAAGVAIDVVLELEHAR
jgi:hypothetical protein